MKSPAEKWFIHIEITNHCGRGCLYCSRYERHIPNDKRYHMTVDQVANALKSLDKYPSRIALMGGEPQLHPQFKEICELLGKFGDKNRFGLWTSIDPKKSKYRDHIEKYIGYVAYNPHTSDQEKVCKHQPITLACKDMVVNPDLRNELIEQCYFGIEWCGSINPLGGYHCEVAAAIGYLLDISGTPLTAGWYNLKPDQTGQKKICQLCGLCVPQERQVIGNKKQLISKTIYDLFKQKNIDLGDYTLVTEPYSVKYLKDHSTEKPGAYRGDIGETEKPTINVDWSKYEN